MSGIAGYLQAIADTIEARCDAALPLDMTDLAGLAVALRDIAAECAVGVPVPEPRWPHNAASGSGW